MTRQEPAAPTPVAAFFDVDNTIIRGASAFHIARGLKQRGYFRNRDLIRFGWEQLKYLVFGESPEQMTSVRTEALSIIKGWSVIHISEPTRLRRISYAVFCLKKKKKTNRITN